RGVRSARAPAAVAAAGTAANSSQAGWIRLPPLSPTTPPVDVYLYSFGGQKAMIVLRHVAYGTVSPYEKLASGEYTVAMRGAGAKASSPPVLSANVHVAPGAAYTVAGLGPAKGLRLAVLHDQLTTPRGKSLVRVIQASLRDHTVTVTAGRQVLARHLAFGNVTGYGPARPGDWMVHVSGAAGMASQSVRLSAGTIHTPVGLGGTSGGLMLRNLREAARSPPGAAARAARPRRRAARRRGWVAPRRSRLPRPCHGPARPRPGRPASPPRRTGCAGSGTRPVTPGSRRWIVAGVGRAGRA